MSIQSHYACGPKVFSRKSVPDEVAVTVALMDEGRGLRDFDLLHRMVDAAGDRFGFRFVPADAAQVRPAWAKLAHFILVVDGPVSAAAIALAGRALISWDSVSVAFAYRSRQHMRAAEADIEAVKARFGPRLNLFFPDVLMKGWLAVSDSKIADNAVCDTVRVKYVPQCLGKELDLPNTVKGFFRSASSLYKRERLYLRAPTDGYIAVRHDHGFFVTATKTRKIDIDLDRIAFVEGYDEPTNTLSYRGPYLPSSDSVEAALVLAARPQINALIHTHASKLFTRNPAYAARVLVPALPYGEPKLGRELVDALGQVNDGFVIMEQHGEVFAGEQGDALLASIAAHVEAARRGLADA